MKRIIGLFKSILIILVSLITLPYQIQAQQKARTNYGNEFYLAFPQNMGSGDETKNIFALYITSKVPTKGTIDVQALAWNTNFTVTPGVVTIIELPNGKNAGDPTVECTSDEKIIQKMAVHVSSDDDIAVYGMCHKEFSTDAFMGLPVSVLGTTYRTLNYQTSGSFALGSVTPGEFLVVAIQDSTHVKITSNAQTHDLINAGSLINIIMQKGDIYLLQGNVSDSLNDLTGSLIESDLPVAVFSGHVRTEIPNGSKNINSGGSTSRNYLVEQLPPVSLWGYSVIVVPYLSPSLPDVVRILSGMDGNRISINGSIVKTLNSGDFYEITQLISPVSIKATGPILVGQYMHTSKYGTVKLDTADGDPCYSVIYPIDQFDTAYTFTFDQNQIFARDYINIISDSSGIHSIILDSNKLSDSLFNPVPATSYEYAQVQLGQGTHTIKGEKPFGITVYALGTVDAYSFPGGVDFTKTNSGVSIFTPLNSEGTISGLRSNENPLEGEFSIQFLLKSFSHVSVCIYDDLGRHIWGDLGGSSLEAGSHSIQIDGSKLPGGTLYARIATGFGEVKTIKLVHN